MTDEPARRSDERNAMSDEQSGRGNSAILESAMLEEELRFAKKQQWNVAAAVVALLGAIFAIANATEDLQTWEQFVASLMAALAAGIGCWWLWRLQNHLRDTRLRIDPKDRNPWHRGWDVLYPLLGTLLISAIVVIYFLWR
jgi:SNF family Na+-dependent transporter